MEKHLTSLVKNTGIVENNSLDQLEFNQDSTKVFIYIVNITKCKLNTTQLDQYLSTEEKNQANKYCTNCLRRRYIISHGILRCILSYYVKQHPRDIEFSYGEYGKPFLKDSNIQFNMSHSHDIVSYAIALNHRVGIDVELHDNNLDVQEFASLVFTPTEYSFFTSLDAHEKLSFFYHIWTKKESLVKANGQGLSYPINTIESMILERFFFASEKNRHQQKWYYFPLTVVVNYSAALTIEHQINQIIYLEMNNLMFIKTKLEYCNGDYSNMSGRLYL